MKFFSEQILKASNITSGWMPQIYTQWFWSKSIEPVLKISTENYCKRICNTCLDIIMPMKRQLSLSYLKELLKWWRDTYSFPIMANWKISYISKISIHLVGAWIVFCAQSNWFLCVGIRTIHLQVKQDGCLFYFSYWSMFLNKRSHRAGRYQ